MKFIKILGIGVITTIALSSCNKYEDGPIVSLKSKKARVENTWVVAEATNEGNDVTSTYDRFELYLSIDGDATLEAEYQLGDIQVTTSTDGTWSFNNNKEDLILDYENDDADEEYQILKLSSDELWLRVKGDDLEIHFESK